MGPVTKAILFIDAISTLISLSKHPALFPAPANRYLAQTNINLIKCAAITQQKKDTIACFLNQNKRQNMADLISKHDLINDTPELWLKLQKELLNPQWLQKHPSTWLTKVEKEST